MVGFIGEVSHPALVMIEGCNIWVSGVDDLVSAMSLDAICSCSRLLFQMKGSQMCSDLIRPFKFSSQFLTNQNSKTARDWNRFTNHL